MPPVSMMQPVLDVSYDRRIVDQHQNPLLRKRRSEKERAIEGDQRFATARHAIDQTQGKVL